MSDFDLTILGGGPGGYVAALYAAGLRMKVCLIEKDNLGGVCLNSGCIPTKTLAVSRDIYSEIKNAGKFGINVKDASLDFRFIISRKNDIVKKLRSGIETLLKARGVTVINEKAMLLDKNTVQTPAKKITSKYIIIATGSTPAAIPAAKVDEKSVLSSEGLLELESVPKELVVIGGGAIGCEFADIFSEFGSRVTIVEMLPNIIPGGDKEVSRRLEAAMKKKNIAIHTNTKVSSVHAAEDGRVTVTTENGLNLACDKVLVSVGRQPNTRGIGLEAAGVNYDKKGIKTDETMKTNIDNIYAIGDCIGGYMFAHTASYQGLVACDNIAGKRQKADYRAVPYCIFTEETISSSGLNEDAAKAKGLDVSVSKFFYRGLGKAHALGRTDGFVKMISDKKTRKLLGVDIMGAGAAELIAEATLAIKEGLSAGELARIIHTHPTLSEAILETAYIADGTPIHSL